MITPTALLSLGLKKGFAGETKFQTISRAQFQLQASHLEKVGSVYHDEWAADRTGGGQELVKVGGQTYTRVYAGGTVSLESLTQLGITKHEIITFLVKCLTQFGEHIRLHESYGPYQDGPWTYRYLILEQNNDIPMTTGKEEILYQKQVVFVHVFVLCPVE